MLFTAHYLVRPRQETKHHAAARGLSELEDWLLEPVVLRKNEPSRSTWETEDHQAQVKLVFLVLLSENYQERPEFQTLFPDFSVSVAEFDRWWELSSVDCFDVDELSEERGFFEAVEIQKTGLPVVDEWIETLKR